MTPASPGAWAHGRACAGRRRPQYGWVMSANVPGPEKPEGKRGLVANLVLVAVWVYVAMIYLLAFDQQFHWGIFSP
jgi:hypothetical protein